MCSDMKKSRKISIFIFNIQYKVHIFKKQYSTSFFLTALKLIIYFDKICLIENASICKWWLT